MAARGLTILIVALMAALRLRSLPAPGRPSRSTSFASTSRTGAWSLLRRARCCAATGSRSAPTRSATSSSKATSARRKAAMCSTGATRTAAACGRSTSPIPNAADKAAARQLGVDPGGMIMIHGQPNGFGWWGWLMQLFDWTNGCIAVTDADMLEIWDMVQRRHADRDRSMSDDKSSQDKSSQIGRADGPSKTRRSGRRSSRSPPASRGAARAAAKAGCFQAS